MSNQATRSPGSCHHPQHEAAVAGGGWHRCLRPALESRGAGRVSRITDGSHVHRHEGLRRLLRVVLLRVVCGSGSMLLVASDECPRGLNVMCSEILLLIHGTPCVASFFCLSFGSLLPHSSKHASVHICSRGFAWLLFCCHLFPFSTLTLPALIYISVLAAMAPHFSNRCKDTSDGFA